MRKLSSLAFIAAFSIAFSNIAIAEDSGLPAGAERTEPWNSENSDLPVDRNIIYGKLANGLTYAIRPNSTPENEVRVRMVLEFGSAAEEEDEQGLAHFIEHMAFNGTTNVPEGEMVKMLERLGLQFGADTNASTSFTRTSYKLNLPRKDVELIDKALFLMREAASEITFAPEAVDRERGIVLSEKRQRENFSYRALRARNSFLYPGTYFSERYPIGKVDILKNASAAKMKALYQKWYRPDRTRIVISGAVDPAKMEAMIAEKFSSWQNPAAPLGEIDRCTIDTGRQSAFAQFVHPKSSEAVSIRQIVDYPKITDNFATNVQLLKLRMAGGILQRRISRKSRAEDIPLLGANFGLNFNICDQYASVTLSIGSKDGKWKETLPIAEQLLRQAVQHGFQDAEVEELIKSYDNAYENAAKRAATRRTAGLTAQLENLDYTVISSPQQNLDIWRKAKSEISAESIHAEFKEWYSKIDRPLFFFQGKETVDGKDLIATYNTSRKVAVQAPDKREAVQFAYTDFGKPGEILEDNRIEDLDIRTVKFANNVLLNIKKTDFEDNRVRFSVRVAGGRLIFGKENAPLGDFMNATYVSGGLGQHDIDDMRSIFAGTTVSRGFGIRGDYFGNYGSFAPKDLQLQMQTIAALITDPGYREEAIRLYRRPLEERYKRLDATPGSALSKAHNEILTGDDPRFTIPPLEKVKTLDFEQLKAALGDALATNQLEIAVVGDIEEDAVIKAVASSLGALPKRQIAPQAYQDARQSNWSDKTGIHTVTHKGEKDQLGWRRSWTTTDRDDQRLMQTMQILARVTSVMLIDKLREELGASYGGNANSYMSDVYENRGLFSISTAGDPQDIAVIEDTVDEIVAQVIKAPVSEDIFARAVKPIEESYRDWRKKNGTWISIVDEAQSRPDKLDRFRRNEEIFRSITREEVHQAAIRFLKDRPSYIFRSIPEGWSADNVKKAEAEAEGN